MYKPELKSAMIKLMSEFFQVERGNRVTGFNIEGLITKMQVVFNSHEVPDEDGGKDGLHS